MTAAAKDSEVVARFPPVFDFLFRPARYKVAYGGRGSGKSWAYARALLIKALERPIRVLCAREVQKSIKQSVHTLLSDQIQLLGLGSMYNVTDNEIRALNGSSFTFAGLQGHTVESVKSFEAIDIVWVEEAQTVSKKSWDILIPTIRARGSEIWVTFNPDLDTDETYQRFVVDPPSDCVVVKVNYDQNPWFSPELELERADCERRRPKDYPNIWLGMCKSVVDGAIYADEVTAAIESGRVCHVPYDPKIKVHTVFDLGWNDSTFICLVQRVRSEIRIIKAIEDDHKTLDYYSAMLREYRYNWGKLWLPHDGETADFRSGRSAASIMRSLGWQVGIVPRHRVEDGIREARMAFGQAVFDREGAARLIDCLKRYRRNIPTSTGEPATPIHDEYSHGADCFRYVCAVADRMSNEESGTLALDDLLPHTAIDL